MLPFRRPARDPRTDSKSDDQRMLVDPHPDFLRTLLGYNREQVERWVSWQQRLLARNRARLIEIESELDATRSERDRALSRVNLDAAHFRMPPNSNHAAARLPRHLRQERREPASDL
jgi:hypothetical protein